MQITRRFDAYAGIDPGTTTGIALWDAHNQRFISIDTFRIHQALERMRVWVRAYGLGLMVICEDARKAKFKQAGFKAVGAGSVMRDALIWEEFLQDAGCYHMMTKPNKEITKLKDEQFKAVTGYNCRTSVHGRDAAMLVWGKKP